MGAGNGLPALAPAFLKSESGKELKMKAKKIISAIVAILLACLCWQMYPCDGAVEPQVAERKCLCKELPTILRAARRNKCEGDNLLILLAIRRAENGRAGREFGILHPRAVNTDLDTQAGWAAATIVKNRTRWLSGDCPVDFVTFLGNRYCPASADLEGNINWKRNVRFWFQKFGGKL